MSSSESRKKSLGDDLAKHAVIDQRVNDLIRNMKEASEKDKKAFKNEQPACHKLAMLGKVTVSLGSFDSQQTFVDEGGIDVLLDWMFPLAYGCAPNLDIRETMMEILLTLPLEKQDVSNTLLRNIVLNMSLDKEESPKVRQIANQLLRRWCPTTKSTGIRRSDMFAMKKYTVSKDEEYEEGIDAVRGHLPHRARIPKADPRAYIVSPGASSSSLLDDIKGSRKPNDFLKKLDIRKSKSKKK